METATRKTATHPVAATPTIEPASQTERLTRVSPQANNQKMEPLRSLGRSNLETQQVEHLCSLRIGAHNVPGVEKDLAFEQEEFRQSQVIPETIRVDDG